MKTMGTVMPEAVSVLRLPDGMAEIVLCDKVEQIVADNSDDGSDAANMYRFDLHLLHWPWRETLAVDVAANFEAWVALAEREEAAAAQAPATANERMAKLERENERLANAMEELTQTVTATTRKAQY